MLKNELERAIAGEYLDNRALREPRDPEKYGRYLAGLYLTINMVLVSAGLWEKKLTFEQVYNAERLAFTKADYARELASEVYRTVGA